jgi:5'-phosphate synthase pdxT subunit
MQIGIVALQGGFAEHRLALESLNVDSFEIRKPADLDARPSLDGLILPGGESTVMRKLLDDLCLFDELKSRIASGLPVFGTCAGLILLAERLSDSDLVHFGLMHIRVKRNAYGRQLGSFYTESEVEGLGILPMTFIRAPYIESAGPDVEILARIDRRIVAARQQNMLVTAWHPELTGDRRIHQYFIDKFILHN